MTYRWIAVGMTRPVQHLVEGYLPARASEKRWATLCGLERGDTLTETDGTERCLACTRKLFNAPKETP